MNSSLYAGFPHGSHTRNDAKILESKERESKKSQEVQLSTGYRETEINNSTAPSDAYLHRVFWLPNESY